MRGLARGIVITKLSSKIVKRVPQLCGFNTMTRKPYHQSKSVKRQKNASKPANDGSNEEVLLVDVKSLLSRFKTEDLSPEPEVGNGAGGITKTSYTPPEQFSEVVVTISELSSTGDGLGLSSTSDHVYVVPFTVAGDVVKAKVVNHFRQAKYTLTDFVKVIEPAPQRNNSLAKCPHFSRCAGCQIQMLSYESQLQHKKTIVEKAFRNFSTLTPEVIPAIGDTIGSPLQYGYRTKLTPHFDSPPGSMSRKFKRDPSQRKGFETVPPIGFNEKGTRKTIDIEDCPIGTDAVREGLKREREKVAEEIAKYTKGATILLRESTLRKPFPQVARAAPESAALNREEQDLAKDIVAPSNAASGAAVNTDENKANGEKDIISTFIDEKTCITDQRAISTEYIDNFEFKNTAGAFFQNNNSILPTFTAYIRSHILPPVKVEEEQNKPIECLIDAYCGSGLFTITLSSLFKSSLGIDIASASIVSAKENATANKVSNATFMTADASKLFEHVTYSPENTVVIIDPPRRGCDEPFLQQLLKFGPQRVVYVSCNVHTQARDVGILVEGVGNARYEIESLQGFDFFPQTGHVEDVAILTRSA